MIRMLKYKWMHHTKTHTHTYICIYIYIMPCAPVQLGGSIISLLNVHGVLFQLSVWVYSSGLLMACLSCCTASFCSEFINWVQGKIWCDFAKGKLYGCVSYVYWTVHHLDSWIKIDQLDVTCCIISLFNAQHVPDVSTSILRSLRLICWP